MLILGQHGILGDVRSEVDLSYLSDIVLLFRFFEAKRRAALRPGSYQEPGQPARTHYPRV